MFIVVTVETQQLPIAAVPRIIVVVMVFVMDRELTKLFAIKFASAPGTDPLASATIRSGLSVFSGILFDGIIHCGQTYTFDK